VLGDASRTVSPRDLDASVDTDAVAAAALAGELGDVEVGVGDEALHGVIGAVADGQEVAARDASLDVSEDGFDITSEQVGQGVDRGAATEELRAALAGGTDRVELSLTETRPSVTASSFGSVLVLDRSARELALYRDGDVARSWPVAVGASSSPTPTGQFTVGAKRFEPTWVNPARDRWGADLPERMGPGPDNPLGARALNWSDSAGRDTLIRFHGTPNEGSIGSATSNGCVRMFNADVIELYDLVSSGTVIISHS
jgi:lipoprotein-anchoring transpeptidase ErfK/SrfK